MSVLQLDWNAKRGEQRFQVRRDNEVHTRGVDYSGRIYRLNTCGEYQVWYKQSGSCFSGRGSHSYVAPWLVLLKVEGDPNFGLAIELEGQDVDRTNSRSYKKHLLEECNRLGNTVPVYTPLPKKPKKEKPNLPTQDEREARLLATILDTVGANPSLKNKLLEALKKP